MFVVGNETPFRQKEEVGLVLCFSLISNIQHFSTDNCNCHVLAHSSMHSNAELKLLTSISVAKTAYNFKSSVKIIFTVTLYSDKLLHRFYKFPLLLYIADRGNVS